MKSGLRLSFAATLPWPRNTLSDNPDYANGEQCKGNDAIARSQTYEADCGEHH